MVSALLCSPEKRFKLDVQTRESGQSEHFPPDPLPAKTSRISPKARGLSHIPSLSGLMDVTARLGNKPGSSLICFGDSTRPPVSAASEANRR